MTYLWVRFYLILINKKLLSYKKNVQYALICGCYQAFKPKTNKKITTNLIKLSCNNKCQI